MSSDVTSRLQGWIQAAHPYPILMVMLLTGLMGYASAEGRPDAARFGAMMLAILFSQLCIGWSNDYIDRDADSLFQPFKPVPSGQVEPVALGVAAGIALVASLATGVFLGYVAFGLLLLGTATGLAYNAGVKDTALSWLPYVVGFAVLPLFVWAALDTFRSEFLWLYPVGASLAIAAHIANSLPDVDADEAAGRTTLTVLLGRSRSLLLMAAALLLPLVIVGLSLLTLDYVDSNLILTVTVYLGLLFGAIFAYRVQPERDGAILGFRLVAAASVFFAGGWLASLH